MAKTDPTAVTFTLTLAELEDALESGVRAVIAGRQQKKNIEPEMKKARPKFRARLRSLQRKYNAKLVRSAGRLNPSPLS